MSIDRMVCRDQLERFAGLSGYPKVDGGKRSLLDAMQTFPTDAALRSWADDVLRNCDRCPIPRDAYKAAYEARPVVAQSGYRCTVCYDTGKTYGPYLVTYEGGKLARSERLTVQQEADLWARHVDAERRGDASGMLRLNRQWIYQGPVPCECRSAALAQPGQ